MRVVEETEFGNWQAGLAKWPLLINVVPGLEGASVGILRRASRARFKPFCPGFIMAHKNEIDNSESLIRRAPIFSFGSFLKLYDQQVGELNLEALRQELKAAVTDIDLLGKKYWISITNKNSKLERKLREDILKFADFGLINDPADYQLTLKIVTFKGRIIVLLGPSISVKQRFNYRETDVGASINPVLASAIVRLAPPSENGTVIDPTCGSGTLLAERMMFGGEETGLGIDISGRAEQSFAANMIHLSKSIKPRFKSGDACDPENWTPCNTVVSNLPFGLRVKPSRTELSDLYYGVAKNASRYLQKDGKIIVTSSYKSLLLEALESQRESLEILARYKAEMGGIVYQIFIVKKH